MLSPCDPQMSPQQSERMSELVDKQKMGTLNPYRFRLFNPRRQAWHRHFR